MPVYIHLANLFVKKSSIESKYDGGIDQFRIDYSITEDNYNQEDDKIIAIARMNVSEFNLDPLIAKGLHFDSTNNYSTDFTIRPRYGTYLWESEWMTDNNVFAWHKESSSESIDEAVAIGELTMDVISEMFEKGENPFATII